MNIFFNSFSSSSVTRAEAYLRGIPQSEFTTFSGPEVKH